MYRVSNSEASRSRWRQAKVLVIDEVSMLAGEFFDKVEYVARKIRGNELPFGGLQVRLTFPSYFNLFAFALCCANLLTQ